jgi:hypothetical protein
MSSPLPDNTTVRVRFDFSDVRDYYTAIEPAKFIDGAMDVPLYKQLNDLKDFLARHLDLGLDNTTLEFCTFRVHGPSQLGAIMKDEQTLADVLLFALHFFSLC